MGESDLSVRDMLRDLIGVAGKATHGWPSDAKASAAEDIQDILARLVAAGPGGTYEDVRTRVLGARFGSAEFEAALVDAARLMSREGARAMLLALVPVDHAVALGRMAARRGASVQAVLAEAIAIAVEREAAAIGAEGDAEPLGHAMADQGWGPGDLPFGITLPGEEPVSMTVPGLRVLLQQLLDAYRAPFHAYPDPEGYEREAMALLRLVPWAHPDPDLDHLRPRLGTTKLNTDAFDDLMSDVADRLGRGA